MGRFWTGILHDIEQSDAVVVNSDFVGFPVSLPVKRERQAKTADPEIIRRAKALYGDLDAHIEALPDVFRPPLPVPGC